MLKIDCSVLETEGNNMCPADGIQLFFDIPDVKINISFSSIDPSIPQDS